MVLNNDLEKFLEEYYVVERSEYRPNIFEISGFPHYENVFSNVFAFFLGKCPYVLKALLDCIDIVFQIGYDDVMTVNREEKTETGKRIDIVINTNKFVIGIENKIYAPLYNDTTNYYNHLADLAKKDSKTPVCIILSKNETEKTPKNYHSILHSRLAVEIKKYYGIIIKKLDYKYFFLLNEFIENIENLNGGIQMNSEFLKIARNGNNVEKINNIISLGIETQRELKNIAVKIRNEFESDTSFKRKWIYDDIAETGYLSVIAVLQDCFLTDKKYNYTFDIDVSVNGFTIFLFERAERTDKEMWDVLDEIIPNFSNEFKIIGKRAMHETIPLNNYDQLIEKMNNYLNYFKEYIKQKHGA
jgi:hypothetical protein